MLNDVIDLRDFYRTSLGQLARRVIRRRVRLLWPDASGMSVLGLGYATPYLRPFVNEAERVVAAMPARQGAVHWPAEGPSVVALADETELPFPDASLDRVLLVHALEAAPDDEALMREVWRVLNGSGRLLVVVPNRRGIWARLERTPFGHGRPYSPTQLSRFLREMMFTPIQTTSALYAPPSASRMIIRSAPAWEQVGHRWFQAFAGVIMIEAGKQVWARSPRLKKERKRQRVYLPLPSPAPTPQPKGLPVFREGGGAEAG